MVDESTVLFYSNELNEDIHQNKNLLTVKQVLIDKNMNTQINENSFSSIVDSKDYLGCINGNCSKINCESDCESKSKTKGNNKEEIINQELEPNKKTNFISKLVDFLFMLFIIGLLIFILYKRSSEYLLYVLGITIIFIFYKIYVVSN